MNSDNSIQVLIVFLSCWLETTLVKILRNEGNMEAYLRQYETNCSLIDPVIWKIHLSAPVRKRMNVLNRFLGQLLNKYSVIFSFLPKPLVLARVYKKLHIPFSVNPSRMSSIEVSLRRIPKYDLTFMNWILQYRSWKSALYLIH